MATMNTVRVYGPAGRRSVDIEGVTITGATVTVEDAPDSLQEVTVRFCTDRATVLPAIDADVSAAKVELAKRTLALAQHEAVKADKAVRDASERLAAAMSGGAA